MDSETPYRVMLGVVFIASIAVAGYYRARAAKPGERISRRDEGRLLFLSIRLSGLFLFAITLLYLLRPQWVSCARLPLPGAVRGSGFAIGLLSVALVGWTLRTLGGNLTDTVATRTHHTLVTTGPYRWVRHPYYAATLLLVIAATLLSANWLIGVAGALMFLLLAVRTPLEEQKLIERFGDQYRDYAARRGRFIPRMLR